MPKLMKWVTGFSGFHLSTEIKIACSFEVRKSFLFLQDTSARTQVKKNINESPFDSRSIANFDAKGYLAGAKLKEGQDPYANNAYNQKASEEAAFNRVPPDVRHSQ